MGDYWKMFPATPNKLINQLTDSLFLQTCKHPQMNYTMAPAPPYHIRFPPVGDHTLSVSSSNIFFRHEA